MKRKGDSPEKPAKKKKVEKTVADCQTQAEVEKYSVADLKEYLGSNGLAKSGNKPTLVTRVFRHLEKLQSVVQETLKEFLCVFGSPATEGTLFSRINPDLGNLIYSYWENYKAARAKGIIKDSYSFKAKFGSSGRAVGRLARPSAIALDGNGALIVADRDNDRIQVFQIDGTCPRSFEDYVSRPRSVAYDSSNGDIVVLGSREIVIFNTEGKIAFRFLVGSQKTYLSPAGGMTVDKGNIVIANSGDNTIDVHSKNGNLLKSFGGFGSGLGELSFPTAVAVDLHGNYIVADQDNSRVQIFDPEGTALRVFGKSGGDVDDGFESLTNIQVDQNGRMLITDENYHEVKIFSLEGKYLGKVGGWGTTEGELHGPCAAVVDSEGQIYIADTQNNRIQVFKPD